MRHIYISCFIRNLPVSHELTLFLVGFNVDRIDKRKTDLYLFSLSFQKFDPQWHVADISMEPGRHSISVLNTTDWRLALGKTNQFSPDVYRKPPLSQ